MKLIIYKNRGAIVPNPKEFIKKRPKCVLMDESEVFNTKVLYFPKIAFKGLSQDEFAWFWLKDKQNKYRLGTNHQTREIRKEISFSLNEIKKAFQKSVALGTSKKKPTKCKMQAGAFNHSMF